MDYLKKFARWNFKRVYSPFEVLLIMLAGTFMGNNQWGIALAILVGSIIVSSIVQAIFKIE